MLDGMDSFIYALVLRPALTELLPKSGIAATPAAIGTYGSILFALFLVGWGLSFIWGPIADRFGRTRTLAGTILVYAVFTGAAYFADSVWQLAIFRFLAGVGIGGEWAMAGTYVAEAWPEDRRKMGAGYLQTGYYAGFFVAAALNYTVGAHFGWRAMFLCGLAPVVVALYTLLKVREPKRWAAHAGETHHPPLVEIFGPVYRKRTLVNSALITVAIIGLWAGAVYEPAAVSLLAKQAGFNEAAAAKIVSLATAVLSIGTILGCIALPVLAERIGRRATLAIYFAIMLVTIPLAFGWAFYLKGGLVPFIALLFVLGFGGGNFAAFSLWLPEQYATRVRATAFAFATSVGRFIGAGVNFALAAMVAAMHTIGTPVALTAIAFLVGIAIVPLAIETKGETLPA
ncbi:putative arabinose efflux permease, MFS family [Beijerinckiaceae bacterium RH AL1]|nr:putative arabinose efflux permease, MFS family [Beijerinckiaceae bacterium RH AL8]VVB43454.1 putative arabinose efflux permease, MFS family [Beijerinckiaceae bacterium RH CH11]VVC53841.1 putative arabinose efflux permease, MFS family [Beijerinckiaceae bacterium RH AL1]